MTAQVVYFLDAYQQGQKKMSEEIEDTIVEADEGEQAEVTAKPRFKIVKPNPIVYFIAGPFLIVFIIYIVLTKIIISSDLGHEAKLKEVMSSGTIESDELTDQNLLDADSSTDPSQAKAGFLDTHNYFQFPVSFAVNIPETSRNLTFELAVSSFQSGVTAEWFFESFTAFVPAIRSDILYFVGTKSLEDLQASDAQLGLLKDIKDVINSKLESLGADPEISKVMFISYIVT